MFYIQYWTILGILENLRKFQNILGNPKKNYRKSWEIPENFKKTLGILKYSRKSWNIPDSPKKSQTILENFLGFPMIS